MPSEKLRLAVVTPVFNDWASFRVLAGALDDLAPAWDADVTLLAIDDGSTEPDDPSSWAHRIRNLQRIEIIALACNLGHQRAISVGLCEVASRKHFDAVVVVDSDGEDQPSDVGRLIEAHRGARSAVIGASRSKRSEGPAFRALYRVYKVLFKLLTGKVIDFGNFCLLPADIVGRLIFMPELWNHLAAAVVRSRLQLVRVATQRGTRYAGRSSMNLVSLIMHGLSAISVFTDVLFVRILVLSGVVSFLALTVGTVAAVLRLTTEFAIPGWASTVIGLSAVILFQSLTLSALGAFMMLANRSSFAFVPATHALLYIQTRVTVSEPHA